MACNTKAVIYGDESWGQASVGNVRIREKQLVCMVDELKGSGVWSSN